MLSSTTGVVILLDRTPAGEEFVQSPAEAIDVTGRGPTWFQPAACSGGMYAGVPIVWPIIVPSPTLRSDDSLSGPLVCSNGLASPQSTTRVSPYSPSITLAGLRIAMEDAAAVHSRPRSGKR